MDKDKHDFLTLADYFLDCFTQEGEEGFIEVIRKHWARSRLEKGAVVILPTGWCNQLVMETEPNYFVLQIPSNNDLIYDYSWLDIVFIPTTKNSVHS